MAQTTVASGSDKAQTTATVTDMIDFTGTHEVEENCAEAGGPLSLNACSKNPGHPQFIPVDEFSEDHVRSVIHKDEHWPVELVTDLVRCCQNLVVRINAPFVSKDRPDGYPFARYRGTRTDKVGSGFVSHSVEALAKPCGCWECKQEKPDAKENKDKWYSIIDFKVETARHVVFDDAEASQCEVVFFDNQPSGTGRFTLAGGWQVDKNHTKNDYCVLYRTTHLVDQGKRLLNFYKTYEDLRFRDHRETNLSRSPRIPAAVISHPHGRMKYITLGHIDALHGTGEEKDRRLLYTVPTCPGSSGGMVLRLDYWNSIWSQAKPHCSARPKLGNQGFSVVPSGDFAQPMPALYKKPVDRL
ncbi:uncharacterized protein LOC101851446 [Aplysia californica]|uniref:Uncharacterized protein LOC101851446 n=1 Tax=Aplysia californica TaxID=6500 RepID=A0ABM0K5N6_APLCA|nr:uncharacterized protein LOC101851446 [Aplysia californica]XP_005109319.1 uncharacterized protein LOC101851446 [Aplysia californica]